MDGEDDYSYDPGEQGFDAGGFEPDAFDDDVGPDDYDVDPIPPPPPATEPQDIPDPPTSDDEYENPYGAPESMDAPDVQPPSYTDYTSSAQAKVSSKDVTEKQVAGTLFGYFKNYPAHVTIVFFTSIVFLFVNLGIILTILFLETGINFISLFILGYISTNKDHYYKASVFTLVAMLFLIMALFPLLVAFVCGFLQAFFSMIRLHFMVPVFAQCYCINLACCCCCTVIANFVILVGCICWFTVNGEVLTYIFGGLFIVFIVNVCLMIIGCVGPCFCCGFCINQGSSQTSMIIQMFSKREIKTIGAEPEGVNDGLSRD